jgi:hypothetical protein
MENRNEIPRSRRLPQCAPPPQAQTWVGLAIAFIAIAAWKTTKALGISRSAD